MAMLNTCEKREGSGEGKAKGGVGEALPDCLLCKGFELQKRGTMSANAKPM